MVAEMIPVHQADEQESENVVDLDAMTVEELVKERADVWSEIMRIEGQLADPELIYGYGAAKYTHWRGQAQRALRWKKTELRLVNDALSARRLEAVKEERAREKAERDAAKAARREEKERNRIANGWRPFDPTKVKQHNPITPEEAAAARNEARRKRAAVIEALQGKGGLDGLLVRVAVALHHWHGDQEMPERVTEEDRQALRELSVYLKDRFGGEPLSGARMGRITADSDPERIS